MWLLQSYKVTEDVKTTEFILEMSKIQNWWRCQKYRNYRISGYFKTITELGTYWISYNYATTKKV